ncbi:hypothetical protein BX666DRAFT_1278269 [Dichotomocladium elegans]|nr:hypothetical protein BX666DRAFT_1278269 [Dichotomocladium elegans]
MSASIAGPSSAMSSQQQQQQQHLRDWLLPIPSDLGINDDSFSTDLIRLFDKRRSRLRVEMTDPQEPHAVMTSQACSAGTPVLSDNDTEDSMASRQPSVQALPRTTAITIGTPSTLSSNPSRPSLASRQQELKEKRRRSAGDLLRRSSAYLRVKMDAFRSGSSPATRSHDNLRVRRRVEEEEEEEVADVHPPYGGLPPPPAKIIVNTTIALPQFNTNTPQSRFLSPAAAAIQPPVITQYPPKPLKYSPVDPPTDEASPPSSDHYKRILHHRISLPVLRVVGRSSIEQQHHHHQQKQKQRRRSDADMSRAKTMADLFSSSS